MDATDRLIVEASWSRADQVRRGLLVVRSAFAVFVPFEGPGSALTLMGARGVDGIAMPVPSDGSGAHVAHFLETIGRLPRAEHDFHLWHSARIAGAWLVEPRQATLYCEKARAFDRYRLSLRRGDEHVGAVSGVPGYRVRGHAHLLAPWWAVDVGTDVRPQRDERQVAPSAAP